MLDSPAQPGPGRIHGLRDRRPGGLSLCFLANAAAAQEVDAPVVRDAKQPRPQRPSIVERVQFPVGLEERLLNDVFTVEHGSGHTGAVPVKARPEIRDRFEERDVTSLELARRVAREVVPDVLYAPAGSGDTCPSRANRLRARTLG